MSVCLWFLNCGFLLPFHGSSPLEIPEGLGGGGCCLPGFRFSVTLFYCLFKKEVCGGLSGCDPFYPNSNVSDGL